MSESKEYFDEILARQTMSVARVPKPSLSNVNTYEALDNYYDEVMAHESESYAVSKGKNPTPFYLKINLDEIEVPRREVIAEVPIAHFREVDPKNDKMETEDDEPLEELQDSLPGFHGQVFNSSVQLVNHPADIAMRMQRSDKPSGGNGTPPIVEAQPPKYKSTGKTIDRKTKPSVPKQPKPQVVRKRKPAGELYVGEMYEYVTAERLNLSRSPNKRVRIRPTRYWCDRPVYDHGKLKGVMRRL